VAKCLLPQRAVGRFGSQRVGNDDSRFFDDSTVKSKDAQNAVDAILAGYERVPLTDA
jgi:hypothetical protein